MPTITVNTPLGVKTIKTSNGNCSPSTSCVINPPMVNTPLGTKVTKSNNGCAPSCNPCCPSQTYPLPIPPASTVGVFTVNPLTGGGQLNQDRTLRLALSADEGNGLSVHEDGLFSISGGSGGDLFVNVTLHNDEIENLTTPQILLPAVSADVFLIPTFLIVSHVAQGTPFDFPDPTDFNIYNDNGILFTFSQYFSNSSNAAYIMIPLPQGQVLAGLPVNQSVKISATNNATVIGEDWEFYIFYKKITQFLP